MNPTAVALVAMACTFAVVSAWARRHLLPWMRRQPNTAAALEPLLWLHAFRYVALMLPSAQLAGLPISDATRNQIVAGDLLGAGLAWLALSCRGRPAWWARWVWLLVVSTVLDVANAAVRGMDERLFDHATGWPWFVLTFYVPALMVSAGVMAGALWSAGRRSLPVGPAKSTLP